MSDVTITELQRWMVRIETKLDKAFEDHERRIRQAERVLYVATGLATTGAAGAISVFGGAMGFGS